MKKGILIFLLILMSVVSASITQAKEIKPFLVTSQGVVVYENQLGLKDTIKVLGAITSFYRTAKDIEETHLDLIIEAAVEFPILYKERYEIDAGCLIILEQDYNEEGLARIKIGAARFCEPIEKE